MLRCVADRVGAAVAAICGYVPGKDYGKWGGAVFVEKNLPENNLKLLKCGKTPHFCPKMAFLTNFGVKNKKSKKK